MGILGSWLCRFIGHKWGNSGVYSEADDGEGDEPEMIVTRRHQFCYRCGLTRERMLHLGPMTAEERWPIDTDIG